MGDVVKFGREADGAKPKPLTWTEIQASSDELWSWCLMILNQVEGFQSGFPIDLPKAHAKMSILLAQKKLRESGYPSKFDTDERETGFGRLIFD